jgi:hypothetical protein
MTATKTRVVGSGFTSLNFDQQPMAFLESFQDRGQAPVGNGDGPGWEAVHPLDSPWPVEIATADAIGIGVILVTLKELWNEPVWWQLAGLAGTETIIDIFRYVRSRATPITATKIIKPPGSNAWRGLTYHNITIVGVPDGDDVAIGTLTTNRIISLAYTNKTPLALRVSA